MDQEELIVLTHFQQDNESAKEEVKEVFQALEELAVAYDQKLQEIENKNKEMENINDELQQKAQLLHSTSAELQQLKDMSAHQKKRNNEMLTNLLRDLAEVGHALCIVSATDMNITEVTAGKVEEKFTVARLYINNLKSEAKNLAQRCTNLETQQTDSNKKISEYTKDLVECRLLISQHEAQMKSLQEESAKLKAAELSSAVNAEEKQRAEQLKIAFENQMDQLRDAHTKQVATLRDEISEKQEAINDLKDLNQKLTLAHQQMTSDHEKLKQDESAKLQELMSVSKKHHQQI